MQIDEDFVSAVWTVVRSVPAGEVITYGDVALETGHPGHARAEGVATEDAHVTGMRTTRRP